MRLGEAENVGFLFLWPSQACKLAFSALNNSRQFLPLPLPLPLTFEQCLKSFLCREGSWSPENVFLLSRQNVLLFRCVQMR